ncbi:hypothetical protein GCK72_021481 [Caenorhabditis remanei]|uniref:Uncharacterized protein n=1 Tax=Caenorhabditis remanei TaxID=31234 RepID=A0A6A5GJY8_CAERE|nr:hypothetical protein GCK72_021481 [Caenorhabditis remanei]KAF1754916.1 hypothetical protein GCK72_021481 [Caenorhabditis remanei]
MLATVCRHIIIIAFMAIDDFRKLDGLSGSDIYNAGVCLAYLVVSFHAQFFTIPLLLINSYISAQLHLTISKLRPEYDGDDLYEIVDGSEESSTKKIDV